MISIIIPTFQRAHILERAYLSVANQTFADWELLIIDDGSNDGTEALVNKWQEDDPRIFFYKRPIDRIKGASTCRNIGIEKAKGKYIAFLDSDDEWQVRRLEECVNYIKKQEVEAIYSGAMVKGKLSSTFRSSRRVLEGESLFDFLLKNDSFIPTPGLVLDAGIAKKVRFNEHLKQHEDYEFILKVGELVAWTFFENRDVIIHWEQKEDKQIDYRSCLWFYEQYSSMSKDKNARFRYLIYMVEGMLGKKPPYPYLRHYKAILEKEGYVLGSRHQLLFAAPFIFHLFLRIRKLVKS